MDIKSAGRFYTYYLLVIAFLSGLAVVGIEISSSRLLGPYFGTSIYVWTNIIGVVLAALAAGYYFGGKLSEKYPDLRVLLWLIFTSGVIFIIVPHLARSLAGLINPENLGFGSWFTEIFFSSFLVSLILFGLPLMLLGMVSPFLIKIYSLKLDRVGEVSGKIFFWSTLGSIVGTFLPSLWLIPTFGTKRTIAALGLVLVLTGVSRLPLQKLLMFLAIPAGLMFLAWQNPQISTEADIIYETESPYQYIRVSEDADHNRHLLFEEGVGIESYYNPDKILTGSFYDYFNLLPYLVDKQKQKVLIVGLAGGTIARQLQHFFPGIEIDGVEIDQKVVDIANDYFDLGDLDINVFVQDGRSFLVNAEKQYDIIVVDAFRNELYIPWTMTTEEFWQSVNDHLTQQGLLAININAQSESELFKVMANTQAKVFKHVYLVDFKGTGIINSMLLASNREISRHNLTDVNQELIHLVKPFLSAKELTYDPLALVLTDDKAPIELMTEDAIIKFRR